MKILVTGASGFVGGAFLQRFAARADLQLFGVARRPVALPNYRQVDLSRPFTLDFRPEAVVHCAALASPWGSDADYQRHNIDATRNVIEFCLANGRPRLVHVSSSSVFYRHEHQLGLREDSPIGPRFVNQYAATKYASERLVNDYAGEHVIVRPRAVFGPGDTVLFPRVLTAARRGRLPNLVNDGPPAVGDLVYIDVLTDVLLRAATTRLPHTSYNITNCEPVVMQDLLRSVLQQLGIAPPRRQVKVATAWRAAAATEWLYRLLRLRSEPPITRFGISVFAYSKTFDCTRMLADFGPPAVTIADGVARFVAWQLAQWRAAGDA